MLFRNLLRYYKLIENFFNSLNGHRPIRSRKTRKYIRALFGIQTRHPNVLAARNNTRLGPLGNRDSVVRTMIGDDDHNVLFIPSGYCYSRTQQISDIKTA